MRTTSWAGGLATACLLALVACSGGADEHGTDEAPQGSAAPTAPSGAPATTPSTPTDVGPKPSAACASDADCDDHDPCTIDRCTSHREGEFVKSACEHVASPSCASDAGSPAVDAAPPPVPQPTCSPLAGTLSTMKTTQSGNAAEAFHNVWCCIGRLNECAFPVGTCIAGQITQTQALAGAQCAAVGSHGTCQDDDATWAVRCDATVLCRIGCDGTCVPETCN